MKIFLLFQFLVPFTAVSQTTYLPWDDKENILLERIEIKLQRDSVFNFSKTRPVSRRQAFEGIQRYLQQQGKTGLSKTDAYHLESFYRNNLEYLPAVERDKYKSRKPFLKNLYTYPASLYEVHVQDFDLSVNPVFQYVVSAEKDNSGHLFLNTRGLSLRGRIANKIGFAAYVTDNQERNPAYVRQWVEARKAVPGEGYYKPFKTTGYDYFEARGYFTFGITRYIDVSFGYDKNFIGNGHRSLFLGNEGNASLFLKLNTRIWKINYQNLFMELHATHTPGGDQLIGKKYAALHHLDVALTKWLNVGLFEGVIFGRKDRFDFGYLNPVIFYRSMEQQNGSYDNALAGLDVKANLPQRIQLYGQLCVDEFLLSEIKKNRGWWANKWGIQAGIKYADAFEVRNLDLQLEYNRVRPFTYSHRDSLANYTHYNQPLAHPLGAGFGETIVMVRYQPEPKWSLNAKLIVYRQGRDSSSRSYGSNIFLPNIAPFRMGDYDYHIGSGWKTDVWYASLLLSYEVKENFFLEARAVYRKQETKTPPVTDVNTSVFSFGLRWNMHRREVDW